MGEERIYFASEIPWYQYLLAFVLANGLAQLVFIFYSPYYWWRMKREVQGLNEKPFWTKRGVKFHMTKPERGCCCSLLDQPFVARSLIVAEWPVEGTPLPDLKGYHMAIA